MNKLYILCTLFTFGFQILAFAQPSNVDCDSAIIIANPEDYCSGETEYTNVNAGDSGFPAPSCWTNSENDVWFQFTAVAYTISILVVGEEGDGTLNAPEVVLYSGDCPGMSFNTLRCNSDTDNNGIIALVRSGLTIGETYFIRIDAINNNQGTFKLCLRNYNEPSSPGQDCNTSALLCNKESFIVDTLGGFGLDPSENVGIPCLTSEDGTSVGANEFQPAWFNFTCDETGVLTFVIDPLNFGDDMDWVLYEIPDIRDCGNKVFLRCAYNSPASNAFGGNPNDCGDLTGIMGTVGQISEDFNCEIGEEDGFVDEVIIESGKHYALMIDNFSETGVGFEISWGGSGTFLGPKPVIDIDPLEGLRCDTSFTVTDLSTFDNGNIISWDWNFGKDAVPADANFLGPHSVNYESFGQKSISLRIETDLGCVVTEVIDIDVLACCSDTSTLMAFAEATSLICPGDLNGALEATQTGGADPYLYSINDGDFGSSNTFGGLSEGIYTVQVQDQKGCLDTAMVNIFPPNEITLDAGPDVTVELGEETDLNATYTPSFGNEMIEWIVNDGLDCTDCLDPTALAPGNTEYVIQVTDENGCAYLDTVVVRTNIDIDRPIFSPNILLIDDPRDGFFMLGTSRAADYVQDLYIYDRWGNLIWEGHNITRNDFESGWDGYFGNFPAQYGVYTWAASVHYIDDKVFQYSGDITLIK